MGVLLLFQLTSFSQDNDAFEQRWEELSEQIEYTYPPRKARPKADWIRPEALEENDDDYTDKGFNEYTTDEVIYSREKRYKNGTNNGVEKHVKKNGAKDFDDLSVPKSEGPDFKPRTGNTDFFEKGDGSFLRFLLYIIGIALIVFLIYHFFIKNSLKSDKGIRKKPDLAKNVNPKNIQKSQLESDLDNAIMSEDYRLALRIYYLMLLKLLIEKDWIKWAKRKTNSHYLLEVSNRKEADDFRKAINMYEWVWYGKNHPKKEVFERFQRFYESFLTRLSNEK